MSEVKFRYLISVYAISELLSWCKVKNRDEEFATTSSTSPLEKLQKMGFSSDDIQKASEECSMLFALFSSDVVSLAIYSTFKPAPYCHITDSTDFDEILEYLLENDNAQDQEVTFLEPTLICLHRVYFGR
jgi:hypothetical protein